MPVIVPKRGSVGIFFKKDPTLIGYWQLQGNSKDASGNGRHGTDYNVIYVQEGFRGGVGSGRFDGSSSKIVLPTPNFNLSSITTMAWIKRLGEAYTGDGKIIDIYGSSNNRVAMVIDNLVGPYTNGVYGDIRTSTGTYSVIGGYLPEIYYPKNFSLVVFVYDGNSAKLYVNNKLVASRPVSGSLTLNSYFYIGQNYGDVVPRYFNGYISEVAVFSRPLSSQEILEYYRWATSSSKKYWYFASLPAITFNSQLNLITNLKTTERINPITSFNFSNAQTSFKEIIRQMTSFNFSGSATATLGRIVQGVIRRIINPRGGGIIKNR